MKNLLFLLLLSLAVPAAGQGVGSPICSEVRDEGAFLVCSRIFDFVGAGVVASTSAGVTTVTISGGGGGGSPGGGTGDVQFNDGAGGFGGETAFDYNTGTNTLDVDNITADAVTSTAITATSTLTVNDSLILNGDTSPSAITTTQNDYAGCDTIVCRLTATAAQNITGLSESQVDGTVRILRNVDTTGADGIWLLHEDAGSTAANRFSFGTEADNVLLGAGASFTVVYDGTLSRWVPLVSDEPNAPLQIQDYFTDLCFNIDDSMIDFAVASSGTITKPAAGAGVAALPCLLTMTTVTAATSSAAITSGQTGVVFSGGRWHYQSGILTSANLSNGTDRYFIRTGFHDSATTTPVDGCYIQYVDNVNSGIWQGICRNNSTESTCNTAVTVAASTYYKFDIWVNSAGTSVNFSVNNSAVCNIAANIPITAARDFGWGITFVRTVGTASRIISADFIRVRFERAAIM